jgi:hypothetical protein
MKQFLVIILTSLLIWILGYYVLDLFSGQVVLSLAVAILGGLLATLFYWAFSQKFLEGFKTVQLVAIVLMGAALSLSVVKYASRQTIGIRVDCRGSSAYVGSIPPRANKDDIVEWYSDPSTADLEIAFSTTPLDFSYRKGRGSVRGMVKAKHPPKPQIHSYKYSGTCNGKPIRAVDAYPMIQIPRKH